MQSLHHLLFAVAHSGLKKQAHLVRVVLQRAVVTVVTDSVPVSVSLVSVVHVWAVILLIQNAWTNQFQCHDNDSLQGFYVLPRIQGRKTCNSPSPSMSMAHASPSPLLSVSVCSGLLSYGQLSHRSPTWSRSWSYCLGLKMNGQLSWFNTRRSSQVSYENRKKNKKTSGAVLYLTDQNV